MRSAPEPRAGVSLSYADSLGQPQQSTYTLGGTAYDVNYTCNTIGAVDTAQYPTTSSPLTEVLGNGVTITSGYTPWTNEPTSRTGAKSGPTTLQQPVYRWDLNGNLEGA